MTYPFMFDNLTQGFQLPQANSGTFDLAQIGSMPSMPSLGNATVPQQPGMFDDLFKGLKGMNWFDKTTNGVKDQGVLGPMIGAASGLMSGYMGMKQLGLAKDTLNSNKQQFDLNFNAQKKVTNSRLADRQATRLASNSNGGYSSVDDYMSKYGI